MIIRHVIEHKGLHDVDDEFISEVLPLIEWEFPDYFDADDRRLLFEFAMTLTLKHEDAIECVTLLKERAQSNTSQIQVHTQDNPNKQSNQEVNHND